MNLEQEKLLDQLKKGGYDKPFTRDGKPKKWLALIIPLFHEKRVKKLKLLNSSNPSITERNYKAKQCLLPSWSESFYFTTSCISLPAHVTCFIRIKY